MVLLTRPVTTPSALTTPPRFSGLVLSVRESRRPPASAAPMPALTSWALLPGSGGAPMVGPEPSRVKTTDVSVPPPIGAWALKPTPTVPTSGTHTFRSQQHGRANE